MTPLARHIFESPASAEEIGAFQEWERRNAARMLSRYQEFPAANAFGLKSTDVVTLDAKVRFDFSGRDPRLFDSAGQYLGTLANAPGALLERFVAALDGKLPVGAICAQPPFAEQAPQLQAFVAAFLGSVFLVPGSLGELESRLPVVELLRFPNQSPYAMPREYWENAVAVREALELFYAALNDFTSFTKGLRGLHRLATVGANGRNYYGGAGGVVTVPGEFRTLPITNRFNDRKLWIFRHWLRLLDVPFRLVESGAIVSTSRVAFVTVSDEGHECRHPYGRDGEQLTKQLDEVRAQLAAAQAALETDRAAFMRHCALFHHAFVHAHPFGNINNSIAMNIVNDLLRRARVGVIPHLYFDQVAHFLAPEDYVDLFARGVEAHVLNDEVGHDRPATHVLLEAVASITADR